MGGAMSAPISVSRQRRQATFRQVDLTRALRGAKAAGLRVSRVKIGVDGAIEILTGDAPVVEHDAFTAWKATYDARPAQRDRHGA
jgi:hypothetical protein